MTQNYVGQVDNVVQSTGVGRVWSLDPLYIYEGEFKQDGLPNGWGRYVDATTTYTGKWVDGSPSGTGWIEINRLGKDGEAALKNCKPQVPKPSVASATASNDKTANIVCGSDLTTTLAWGRNTDGNTLLEYTKASSNV